MADTFVRVVTLLLAMLPSIRKQKHVAFSLFLWIGHLPIALNRWIEERDSMIGAAHNTTKKLNAVPQMINECLGEHTTIFRFRHYNTVCIIACKRAVTSIQLEIIKAKCHPSFNDTIQSYFLLHKGLLKGLLASRIRCQAACFDKHGHFATQIVAHMFLNLGG